MKTFRTEFIVALGTFVISATLLVWSANQFPNDDQFILYRYIDNIAAGKGFVFNLGERVLGATTPLFTLLCAFFKFLLPQSDTRVLVGFINVLLLSASSVFFYRLAKEFISDKYALLATAIFALNISRVALEGMESALFILTVLSFLLFLLRGKHYTASVFLSLTLLTRPDAGLIAVLAFVYWLQHEGWQKTIRYTSLCIAVALPWLAWSTWYFGSFIPASLIAKTHVNEIIFQSPFQAFKVQLSHLSRIYWGKLFDPEHIPLQALVNLLPFVLLCLVALKEKLTKQNWIVFAIPALYLIAFSVSNPVMFPWYLSQTEPLWVLVSMIGFVFLYEYLEKKWNKPFVQVLLLALIILGPLFFWVNSLVSRERGSKVALYEISQYIEANGKDADSIGVNNMGIIAYYTDNYLYDFFGLVNDYAYAFYGKRESCANENAMYVIPPSLVMFTKPTWLVISGDDELSPCFRESLWFKDNYGLNKRIGGATIFRLMNE